MLLKLIRLFLVTYISIGLLWAQNEPQVSHFMFNQMAFNPALTGNGMLTKDINASFLHRQQWVGFDDAPSVQFLAGDYKIDDSKYVGISIFNERIGFEKNLSLALNYAHRLFIDEDFIIAGGLGLGLLSKSLDGTMLVYDDMNDVNGVFIKESKLSPIIDIGIASFYKELTVGISFKQINNSASKISTNQAARHIHLFAEYNYSLNEVLDIIPSVYFRSAGFISQIEVNTLALYNQKLWGGASYRLKDALVLMIGVQAMPSLKIGYSYDLSLGNVKTQSSGSHEIMLIASFAKPHKPHIHLRTPRYFY